MEHDVLVALRGDFDQEFHDLIPGGLWLPQMKCLQTSPKELRAGFRLAGNYLRLGDDDEPHDADDGSVESRLYPIELNGLFLKRI